MKRLRPVMAAAALAVVSGIVLMPVLASAAPASALSSCSGTSLVKGLNALGVYSSIRVPTVGNGTGDDNCELGPGNDSVAVARLQVALDSVFCNYDAGLTVDGIYGSATQTAVRDAQKAYGVPQDGIYGPVTGVAMWWIVAGSNGLKCAQIVQINN
jgi:peptidoglycan hydrolase-like protein with peptidoglycan-binding domain